MNQAIISKQQLISISYIIGGIFFLTFAMEVGNNGIGYMAMVLELICAFAFFVSEEITDFVSKMIRGKKTKGLYKDAYNVKKRVFVIQFITGFVLTILLFVLAEFFAVSLFKIPYIEICIRILAPVIIIKSMETAFLGSFQSSGAQMPAVICAFFRQIFFFVFGWLLIGKFVTYGEKVSALLFNDDYIGMYSAVALCIAITISELLIFLFQFFLYCISDRKKEQKRCKEGLQTVEGVRSTLYYYYEKSIIIFGSQFFYRVPLLLGIIFSLYSLTDPFTAAYSIGNYYGLFLVICSIPIILVEMGTHVMQAKLAQYAFNPDKKVIRDIFASGLHYCIIFAVFFGILFLTLSNQITAVFMGPENGDLSKYVKLGSVLIIAHILSNFGISILKSLNQRRFVLLCTFLGALAALITCFIGKKNGFEVYDYILYSMIFAGVVCSLSSIIIIVGERRIDIDFIQTIVVPLLCVSVVGLLIMFIGNLMTPHLGNLVCLVLCTVFGFVIYIFLLGLARNIHEDEISVMYGELGKRIVGLIFK